MLKISRQSHAKVILLRVFIDFADWVLAGHYYCIVVDFEGLPAIS
jgi:hypothetical protein